MAIRYKLATQDRAETLTNKTLTSPVLTTPDIGKSTGLEVTFTSEAAPSSPASGKATLYAGVAGAGTAIPRWKNSAGNDFSLLRDQTASVINSTGTTLNPGEAVYVVGSSGGFATVARAKADVVSTSSVFGIMATSAAPAAAGGVFLMGNVPNLDTSAFAVGDILYLSDTTAGALTNVAPTGNSLIVRIGTVMASNATTGSITLDIQPAVALTLDALTDVNISGPTLDQFLRYNGSQWVNGAGASTSAGTGTTFFDATPIINSRTSPSGITADGTAGNGITVSTLSKTPVTTTEQTLGVLASNDTRAGSARLYGTALGRTSIDAGLWTFNSYMAVSNTAGTTTLTKQVYQVQVPSGTVTVTGAGANSRTVTASAGTPFAATGFFSASATNTTASYIQLPSGVYQISARTSDTVVTIIVPTGYSNESAVAYTVWNKLLGATSASIESTGTDYQLYTFSVTAPAFTVATTDQLGSISFVTSDASNRTVTIAYNGTAHNSSFTSPLATLHNDLAGLQGGAANEDYHLTAAEYTGSGTGVFARTTSPVFTTPNIGNATGNITGSAGSAAVATALATPRNINGVAFDGTANITVTAAAGTLTGATLASGVTSSSLTSIGTITTGVWNGTTIAVANGGTGVTSATAYAVLTGGTTSTGAFQSVSGVGTTGQVLTSNGAGALPTWQTPSGGSLAWNASISNGTGVGITTSIGASAASGVIGYQSTFNNTQSNNLIGYDAEVGTSAKVAGFWAKGTFGTATDGTNSAFTAWGNTASQNTRALSIGNGTTFTERFIVNTDGSGQSGTSSGGNRFSWSNAGVLTFTNSSSTNTAVITAGTGNISITPSGQGLTITGTNFTTDAGNTFTPILVTGTVPQGNNINGINFSPGFPIVDASGGSGSYFLRANTVQDLTNTTNDTDYALINHTVRINTGNTRTAAGHHVYIKRTGTTQTSGSANLTLSGNALMVEYIATQSAGTLSITGDVIGAKAPTSQFTGNLYNGLNGSTSVFKVGTSGKITLDATDTAAGTTGAQTINKPTGRVNFAAGASTLVVTNSLVTTSSKVFCTVESNDTTSVLKDVELANGSFTIRIVAATAETPVSFLVIN